MLLYKCVEVLMGISKTIWHSKDLCSNVDITDCSYRTNKNEWVVIVKLIDYQRINLEP